ncbi:MAG: nucleotide exchange factor GrpE [Candidatus Thermoplasmatota archaeon]|jgi:molecular chaperone GrpE|nr:nucleotide exchange factor GrpE [Candidatus Thermoplasmatota archaeon]
MAYVPDQAKILLDPIQYSIKAARSRNKMSTLKVQIDGDNVEELKDRNGALLRSLAELQNYTKIMTRDFENQKKTAGMDIIKGIFPLLDSLDSGISSGKDVEMLQNLRKILLSSLSPFGLKEIETVGKKIDLNVHEVVGTVDGENDNVIVHEVQKGYTLNGEVIRTAKVIVEKRGE